MKLKKDYLRQVKIFYNGNIEKIEEDVGDWFADWKDETMEYVDMKFQAFGGGGGCKDDGWEMFAIIIIYDEFVK